MMHAVIFDMDGTMVETEPMWGDVTRKLAERYNAVFDPAVRIQMMGKKAEDSLQSFKDFFGLDVAVEELVKVRHEMVMADLRMIKTKEGLFELLDLLEKLGIKKAVATSSNREFAERTLTTFDLTKRFETIVVGDDVKYGKPYPDIFLEAARRLDVPPEDCLVLEDAQNGVEAAHRAGMKVFAIPHDASRHHDFSLATRVLFSMKEIDEDLLTA